MRENTFYVLNMFSQDVRSVRSVGAIRKGFVDGELTNLLLTRSV